MTINDTLHCKVISNKLLFYEDWALFISGFTFHKEFIIRFNGQCKALHDVCEFNKQLIGTIKLCMNEAWQQIVTSLFLLYQCTNLTAFQFKQEVQYFLSNTVEYLSHILLDISSIINLCLFTTVFNFENSYKSLGAKSNESARWTG